MVGSSRTEPEVRYENRSLGMAGSQVWLPRLHWLTRHRIYLQQREKCEVVFLGA